MVDMQKVLKRELSDKVMSATRFTMEEARLIIHTFKSHSQDIKQIETVLDIRPNLGKIAQHLTRQNIEVYGADIKKERLKFVDEKINTSYNKKGKFYITKKDPRDMGIENMCDAAYCASGIAYMGASPAIVFESVYKALTSPGIFVVTGTDKEVREAVGKSIQQEVEKGLEEKSLMTTNEEKNKILEQNPSIYFTSEDDSSEVTRDALKTVGFSIAKEDHFYNIGTEKKPIWGGYFILARKE